MAYTQARLRRILQIFRKSKDQNGVDVSSVKRNCRSRLSGTSSVQRNSNKRKSAYLNDDDSQCDDEYTLYSRIRKRKTTISDTSKARRRGLKPTTNGRNGAQDTAEGSELPSSAEDFKKLQAKKRTPRTYDRGRKEGKSAHIRLSFVTTAGKQLLSDLAIKHGTGLSGMPLGNTVTGLARNSILSSETETSDVLEAQETMHKRASQDVNMCKQLQWTWHEDPPTLNFDVSRSLRNRTILRPDSSTEYDREEDMSWIHGEHDSEPPDAKPVLDQLNADIGLPILNTATGSHDLKLEWEDDLSNQDEGFVQASDEQTKLGSSPSCPVDLTDDTSDVISLSSSSPSPEPDPVSYDVWPVNTNFKYIAPGADKQCDFCADYRFGPLGCEHFIRNYMHTEQSNPVVRMCVSCALDRLQHSRCTHHTVTQAADVDLDNFNVEDYISELADTSATRRSKALHPVCSLCCGPAFWSCYAKQELDRFGRRLSDINTSFGCGLAMCDKCKKLVESGILLSTHKDVVYEFDEHGRTRLLRADSIFLFPGSQLHQAYGL